MEQVKWEKAELRIGGITTEEITEENPLNPIKPLDEDYIRYLDKKKREKRRKRLAKRK